MQLSPLFGASGVRCCSPECMCQHACCLGLDTASLLIFSSWTPKYYGQEIWEGAERKNLKDLKYKLTGNQASLIPVLVDLVFYVWVV